MADMEATKAKLKQMMDKVGDKAKEIKDSEETKEFIANAKKTAVKVGKKTKDIAIEVGVKAADVAEVLAGKGAKAMHNVKEKNDAAKQAACDAEVVSEEDVEVEEDGCGCEEAEKECDCASEEKEDKEDACGCADKAE